MQMSDGKTLNLENLCQPDQQKKEMSTQQESNSTDENDSNGEDNPDIDTSDDRFDRANSSENESDYPSDEFEENEP
ncbi:hypothetical protein C7B80_05585 [Cyanosarcina cf. burmensis CCALA 770]|nr:hypothetical protein C7B80_05585 [Cyanosarcina cf. burmensis CCALA 770]